MTDFGYRGEADTQEINLPKHSASEGVTWRDIVALSIICATIITVVWLVAG